MVRAPIDRQRGAVLIAVAGVVLILALSMFAVFALRVAQRTLDATTSQQAKMTTIENALAEFVARHRRLPCPALGTVASGAPMVGEEAINPATGLCIQPTQLSGVIPWTTIGLTEDQARDVWNGRITYRVQPSLASNLLVLMNMSWCDPAGGPNGATGASNACAPAPCTSATCMHPNNFLYGKGLQVQDGNGTWLNQAAPVWGGAPAAPPASTGAAYVLVSHGPNGIGAYGSNGVLHQGASGNKETPNRNGQALIGTTVFFDSPPSAVSGVAYYDDVLRHPTISTVLQRAGLGARTAH